jgi:GT2 family glycosyltransferase
MSQSGQRVPYLSIVIVTWNVCEPLRACLRSIPASLRDSSSDPLAMGAALSAEIIVVDNGSADGSVPMVAADFPEVRLIPNGANLGFAQACNQGIRQSRGRYVLLLNPDTLLFPGTLYCMVKFLDEHPQVGALGCRIVGADGQTDYQGARRLPSIGNELLEKTGLARCFPRSRLLGGYLIGFWDHASSRPVETLSGACLMVRRECLAQVGLLDESFFMYCEDADLCLRLSRAGWQVYYYAKAQVVHQGGQSTQQQRDEMGIIALQSIARFLAKHRGRTYATLYRLLMMALSAAKVVYFSLRFLLAWQAEQREYYRHKMALHRRVIVGLYRRTTADRQGG